ncbi:MAG: helix-turn-helix domain-containing protein [Ruminococcus sp.]
MTLGEKISKLRRENNYTQEQLSELLGVSRQSVSKWESDTAYPETSKLIRLSELFSCTTDYLLKDTAEESKKDEKNNISLMLKSFLRERKSEKKIWGMPAWNIAKNARGFVAVGMNAKGVIAIGLKAKGIISVGFLSAGLLSIGMLSAGLVSLGVFALGLLAAGCFSAGIFSIGAISIGIISLGAIAIGDFSAGALSIGRYFASGDNARAMIALGETEASGTLFQETGELTPAEIETVKVLLKENVPTYLSWAAKLIEVFIK